ncbi:type II secretion system protein [bacterium]|nr:type II secretion system protein [bacterium]
MKKAKGFTLIDVLVIAGVVGILIAFILAGCARRRVAGTLACLTNLKQIMLGIKTYTPDYDEWYPTSAEPGKEIDVQTHYKDLGILYPCYLSSLDVFTCPSSGDKMPKRETDEYDHKPFRAAEAKQVSYAYGYNGYAYGYNGEGGKNLPWTESAPTETRVLADRPAGKELTKRSNHKMDGRNFAFADGHVMWISGKQKLLTNPDHPDSKITTQSWWSERPDRPLPKK